MSAESRRFRPVAYARQEQVDELADAVGRVEARLSVIERALESAIADVDALLQALMDNDVRQEDPPEYEDEEDPLEEDPTEDADDEGVSV